MMKNTPLVFLLLSLAIYGRSQEPTLAILHSGTRVSLRGLSVVNDNVLWVSGSNGTVGRSTNAGKNFKWTVIPGFEKTEFRDIEAFDANVAIVMAIGEPASILKTTDGGDNWKLVYENRRKGMFLDAMDFANSREGMVIGDPVDGYAFMAKTIDSGNSWDEWTDTTNRVATDSGEAFFAASGSNLRYFSNGDYALVTGGKRSRLITNETVIDLPLLQGRESTGANAIDYYDNGRSTKPGDKMIIVGGDFSADTISTANCLYSFNGGKTWKSPDVAPHGYRSCVEYLSKKIVMACGLTGIDLSMDNGKTWRLISKESFHVCKIARIGTTVYLAGNNGKVARLTWPQNEK